MKSLKVCYTAPEGGAVDATPRRSSEEAAALERVDNVRLRPLRTPLEAAVEKHRLWANGRRLRVRFLDGVPSVMERVATIAREWQDLTNLTLSFVTSGTADIRISFREKGFSWSTVGTDALTVPASQPTMNYGWLTPSTALREYQRVVRHEFGHALGMIHEHQNPDAFGKIPWDKPKVYAYYAQQGWSKADVDQNIFEVYDEDETNFSDYDPSSIMHYAIPEELTIGDFSIGWNTVFSALDRSFMATQYPEDSPGVIEVGVGSGSVAADLAVGSEVDVFHFAVTDAGTHIATTTGPTDVVMTLHGPNDQGAVITWDDDRGRDRNARIVRKLGAGDYWLSVRHKEPGGTGSYGVEVRRRR
ncbi:MAG: M12 family metallopeptidase [Candidatus Nanopelagicales bacterium]